MYTVTISRTYTNVYGGRTTLHVGTYEGCTESECDMTGEILVKDAAGRTVAWYTHCMGWTLPNNTTSVDVIFTEV